MPHDLTSSFEYLVRQPSFEEGKPFQIDLSEESADRRKKTISFDTGPPEIIHDVRGQEECFSLDSHGFVYIKHHSKYTVAELHDRGTVQERYLAECETILRDRLSGVDRIYLFDWRVRKPSVVGPHS